MEVNYENNYRELLGTRTKVWLSSLSFTLIFALATFSEFPA